MSLGQTSFISAGGEWAGVKGENIYVLRGSNRDFLVFTNYGGCCDGFEGTITVLNEKLHTMCQLILKTDASINEFNQIISRLKKHPDKVINWESTAKCMIRTSKCFQNDTRELELLQENTSAMGPMTEDQAQLYFKKLEEKYGEIIYGTNFYTHHGYVRLKCEGRSIDIKKK